MNNVARSEAVLSALLIALGIAAAGYSVGRTLYNARVAINTAEVKGLAERRVEEATTNARIAASEFAADAGVAVGSIRDAQQGNFVIRDVGEEYGETRSLEKDVRLVTTITFYLK